MRPGPCPRLTPHGGLPLDPLDPLFLHDGSDDEDGDGFGDGGPVTRMLDSATILMRIPLHPDVSVKDHPEITEVTVRRGIPTTLNTPALDPVLMLDGRQPTLQAQALGAITQHAQGTRAVTGRELDLLAQFQKTPQFFSSPALLAFFASSGHQAPQLPEGQTDAERRGRIFFDDLPPDFSVNPPNFKPGACAACHSGPMLNQTNEFLPVAVPAGTRFQSVLVSEFNDARNPVMTFVFRNQAHDLDPATNRDGSADGIIEVTSPDPGRALITGRADDFFPFPPGSFDHLNAFKIPPLWGVRDTAPYFHDNSAKTLEDVVDHYRRFFLVVSDPDGPDQGARSTDRPHSSGHERHRGVPEAAALTGLGHAGRVVDVRATTGTSFTALSIAVGTSWPPRRSAPDCRP